MATTPRPLIDSVVRSVCGREVERVTDPDSADAGWVPAFAIDWALEKLSWKNPAPPMQLRRCVDVIAGYAGT